MAYLLCFGRSTANHSISKAETSKLVIAAADYALNKSGQNERKDEIKSLRDWLLQLNDNSEIENRQCALDGSQYSSLLDFWQQNNFQFDARVYGQNHTSDDVEKLIFRACSNAIQNFKAKYHVDISNKISHVISHSTISWYIPSVAQRIISELPLQRNCFPIALSNLACIGGNVSLDMANKIIHENPKAVVMGVNYETNTTYFDGFGPKHKNKREQYVGNILFGDASISYIVGDPRHLDIDEEILKNKSFWKAKKSTHILIPDTLDAARVGFGDQVLGAAYISSDIPRIARSILTNSDAIKIIKQSVDDVDFNDCEFALHAGGSKIMQAYDLLLKTSKVKNTDEKLKYIRESYKKNGNVGGCSNLFVLSDIVDQTEKDYISFCSLGTGLSIVFGSWSRVQFL
eukprot:373323_1